MGAISGAHTFYNICARMSRISFFSPDEDSCINCRNVGKFLRVFMFLAPVEPD